MLLFQVHFISNSLDELTSSIFSGTGLVGTRAKTFSQVLMDVMGYLQRLVNGSDFLADVLHWGLRDAFEHVELKGFLVARDYICLLNFGLCSLASVSFKKFLLLSKRTVLVVCELHIVGPHVSDTRLADDACKHIDILRLLGHGPRYVVWEYFSRHGWLLNLSVFKAFVDPLSLF